MNFYLKSVTSLVLSFTLQISPVFPQQQIVELQKGTIITSSAIIKKLTYRLNATDSLQDPLIRIEGNNITVDFNDCILQGSNDKQLPNEFYGLAVHIKGDNITIKNAHIRGYKVAIMATGCKNLKIEKSDLSYNYRQHLQSNWLREDVSDWMSYHHNENDEWMRFGAGIYLKDCIKPVIQNNTITNGQCGLMMVRTDEGLITENNFSFNSAIGIGMYRSSRNHVLNNKLDFNVRGYSHGFYNRGQDSAGILAFEQCYENTFAFNSVTHGGDGFFLWAGQTTMDSGKGGCNDNLLYQNDFSYAPTNGVEVTFSRNRIVGNIIRECDHGIWGGYSFNTSILGNKFEKNRIGIAIEHGQDNEISYNEFSKDKEGIRLWARRMQPADWGYANKRDTRSMNYLVQENFFTDVPLCLNLALTENITVNNYATFRIGRFLKMDTTVKNIKIDSSNKPWVEEFLGKREQELKKTKYKKVKKFFFTDTSMMNRSSIRITEWGPYNYSYPILFLKKIDSNNIYYFDVLGPKGKWKIKSSSGVQNISRSQGGIPAEFTAQRTGDDVQLIAEFTGDRFYSQFGQLQSKNKSYTFSFRDFEPEINWNVNWYKWSAGTDPNKSYENFRTVFNSMPERSAQTKKIEYTWWGEIGKKLVADSFATVATGSVTVPKGKYKIAVTADDLVKVFVDGNLVIDFWDATKYKYDGDTHHASTVELGGTHAIRIEHVENSGYATLIFYLKPI